MEGEPRAVPNASKPQRAVGRATRAGHSRRRPGFVSLLKVSEPSNVRLIGPARWGQFIVYRAQGSYTRQPVTPHTMDHCSPDVAAQETTSTDAEGIDHFLVLGVGHLQGQNAPGQKCDIRRGQDCRQSKLTPEPTTRAGLPNPRRCALGAGSGSAASLAGTSWNSLKLNHSCHLVSGLGKHTPMPPRSAGVKVRVQEEAEHVDGAQLDLEVLCELKLRVLE
jgi:hypothetical protein